MNKIKQYYRLCRLSLLRFRLVYTTGAVFRVSDAYRMLYLKLLFRAMSRLNLMQSQYDYEVQRYLADKQQKEVQQ